MRRRAALVAGSLVCLALAAVLALLAADVVQWRDALRSGDVRYRAAADARGLWTRSGLVPFGVASGLLGIDDDLAFRRAVQTMRLAKLEDRTISDPTLAVYRAEAQARLEAILAGNGDPARRSRAASLLAVLGLASPSADPLGQATALRNAVVHLQQAIALDPVNDEAKLNLEVALQRSRGLQLAEAGGGPNASPGGSGSKGAGTGSAGSGY